MPPKRGSETSVRRCSRSLSSRPRWPGPLATLEQVKTTSAQRIANLEGERTKLEARIPVLIAELDELKKKGGISSVAPSPDRDARAASKGGDMFKDCPDCPEMVVIPAGTFTMGSNASDPQRSDIEMPTHEVSVPAFALGQYQSLAPSSKVTCRARERRLARAQRFGRSGFEQTPNDPVVCVTWNDVSDFVNWLSQRTKQTYRLPSEAEWDTRSTPAPLRAVIGATVGLRRAPMRTLPMVRMVARMGLPYSAPVGRFAARTRSACTTCSGTPLSGPKIAGMPTTLARRRTVDRGQRETAVDA